jgi:hypothetical protein
VNSEGVCCEGNIACGASCCDADTQECNEELGWCVTVRACPVGFEHVNDACFRIVPSLDYCRDRGIQEACGSDCTNCVGSVSGSSNYLCAKTTDTICPGGTNDQCLPFFSACQTGTDPARCFAAC